MSVIDQQGNIHAGDGKFSVKPAGENGTVLVADNGDQVTITHPSGATVNVYVGDDGAIVVDFLTDSLPAGQKVRVNVNDGPVFDGDPEAEPEAEPNREEVIAAYEQSITKEVLEAFPTATSWQAYTEEYDNGFYYANSVDVTFTDTSGQVKSDCLHLDGTDAADNLTELSEFDGAGRYTTRECLIPKGA